MKLSGIFRLFVLCQCLLLGFPIVCTAEEEVNNGQDMTKPLSRMDLRYGYKNAPLGASDHDDAHTFIIRLDKPVRLAPNWMLATRLDVPLMLTNKVSDDNKAGNLHFGLSDILGQLMLINIVNEEFAWAAGAQLVLPTATEEGMGTGAYRVLPTVAARWKTGGFIKGSWFALAARWDRSFAEVRHDSVTVNELQFAPIFNIPLPNHWFINLFPSTDIRYNLGDMRKGDTGRWFVPANFLVGKMLSKDIVTTLEVGVPIIDDYHLYDFKLEARIGFFF